MVAYLTSRPINWGHPDLILTSMWIIGSIIILFNLSVYVYIKLYLRKKFGQIQKLEKVGKGSNSMFSMLTISCSAVITFILFLIGMVLHLSQRNNTADPTLPPPLLISNNLLINLALLSMLRQKRKILTFTIRKVKMLSANLRDTISHEIKKKRSVHPMVNGRPYIVSAV